MNTNAILDKSIQKEFQVLHESILTAKADLARSWLVFASSLKKLKDRMDTVGDRETNWTGYLGVSSFEEYCEQKLEMSKAFGYELIASYRKLLEEKPEYETNTDLTPPAETKVRILGNKKLNALRENSPDDYDEIEDMIFNPSCSRRETESKLAELYDNLVYDEDADEEEVGEVDQIKENLIKYWANKKDSIIEAVKERDQSDFSLLINGIYDLGSDEVNSARVENKGIKRIIIANSAKDSDYAEQVIQRAKALDPTIEIVYTGVGNNDKDIMAFPSQLQGAGNYWYMKETLYIRKRKSAFIETFPSPGDIVENLNTALKLGFHCRSTCHYCYQQTSQYTYQDAYSNLEDVKNEVACEHIVNTSTLTIWSVLSHLKKEAFEKNPKNLSDVSNKLRQTMQDLGIKDRSSAISYLSENLKSLITKCDIEFEESDLTLQVENLETYYKKNEKFPLWLWVSEYSDILAIEPIAHQMDFILTELLPINPNVNYLVATKTAYKRPFLKYDGQDRVMVNMNLNPETIINKYETGTSSLDDRLDLIHELQEKGGYGIRLSFEPMIYYDDWQMAYEDLVGKVSMAIDLPSVSEIVLGSIRLRPGLKNRIMRNYPWCDLFEDISYFERASLKDKRERYFEDFRIGQYQFMIELLGHQTDADIILGAEHPEMWGWVGLDKKKFMEDKVYQYGQ
ncbi:MAG: hypothetical protein HQ510_03955 [Candidatus Marinimicrobia bacterium]|nr:hypothetical protein [Candidatus Neomarinimicrobiota bacterium]